MAVQLGTEPVYKARWLRLQHGVLNHYISRGVASSVASLKVLWKKKVKKSIASLQCYSICESTPTLKSRNDAFPEKEGKLQSDNSHQDARIGNGGEESPPRAWLAGCTAPCSPGSSPGCSPSPSQPYRHSQRSHSSAMLGQFDESLHSKLQVCRCEGLRGMSLR